MDNLNEPLVTVGVPFYNSERFLSDAVKSVINQTYTNLEIILMDDGSTDSSLKIALKFKNRDKRIKVISDGENVGLPKRLNQLSELAKGTYYARMDADDIMFPERISKQITYLLKNPKIDVLGTGLISIDNSTDILGLRKFSSLDKVTLKQTLNGPWAAHPSVTGKSSWFKENRYDENLKRAQDFEFWIRTVEKSDFARTNEPLLFYREASTSSMAKRLKSTRFAIRTYWRNKTKIGLLYSIKQALLSMGKVVLYFSFFIFGATGVLIKRRYVKLSGTNYSLYKAKLDEALQ